MKIVINLKRARSIFLDIIVILFITLLLGEISLGIYNHYIPSFIFYDGSYDRFRGKPFAKDYDFKLNSLGFKDEEFSTKKDNIYRIIGIGDSFTFSIVPYKYNYLTQLESQLHRENANVEILNMGIASIGPKDYLSLLVKEGLSLKPDMVLLSFFIGNDFDGRRKKPYEYSYVASLIHYLINIQPNYEGNVIHGKDEYCDDCPTFDHERYLQIEYNRSSIYMVDNNDFPTKLRYATYYLKQIRDICRTQNIHLSVVIIPDELQINQDLLKEIKNAYYPNLEKNKLDIGLPNRLLSNELDKLGIPHIDLYEYFSNSSDQLYRPRNTHWNIAGNQLAANIILKHIRQHLMSVEDAPNYQLNREGVPGTTGFEDGRLPVTLGPQN